MEKKDKVHGQTCIFQILCSTSGTLLIIAYVSLSQEVLGRIESASLCKQIRKCFYALLRMSWRRRREMKGRNYDTAFPEGSLCHRPCWVLYLGGLRTASLGMLLVDSTGRVFGLVNSIPGSVWLCFQLLANPDPGRQQ